MVLEQLRQECDQDHLGRLDHEPRVRRGDHPREQPLARLDLVRVRVRVRVRAGVRARVRAGVSVRVSVRVRVKGER